VGERKTEKSGIVKDCIWESEEQKRLLVFWRNSSEFGHKGLPKSNFAQVCRNPKASPELMTLLQQNYKMPSHLNSRLTNLYQLKATLAQLKMKHIRIIT
jgi:hypothetical protein